MKPQDELTMLKGFIQLTPEDATKRDNLETFLSERSKVLLLDADSLLFNVAHFHLDKDTTIDEQFEDFLSQVRAISNRIEDDGFNVEYVVYFFTTCKNNFRKELLPSYKETRPKNEITKFVYDFKEYVIIELESEFQDVVYSDLYEADDLIRPRHDNDTIICSIDKDLKQIEGAHFDYYRVKTGEVDEFGYDIKDYRGWSYTTKQEGYDMLLSMLLIGDASDNIKGVDGIGKVKAEKLLKDKSNFSKLLTVAREYNDIKRLRINLQLMKL